MVKNLPAKAGDMGSFPGPGISPGEQNGNHSSIAWEILWTEKPGRLQSIELQRARHDLVTKTACYSVSRK